MTKSTASQDRGDTMTHLEYFKKFKRLNPLKPSFSILSFVLVTLVFVICFSCLEYPRVGRGLNWLGLYGSFFSSSSNLNVRPEFLDESGDGCDVFHGNWVWDESYPLYKSQNCPFLDQGFRCTENGRPDSFYTKWRWQPKDCNLPRFDAGKMLEKLRNKRVVFVGDSLGRNHWESLLCMLSSAIPDKNSIYEVNGRPITKHMGYMDFKFGGFNCTVEYYRSPILVVQGRSPAGAPKEVKTTLRVDQIDWVSKKWRDADVLVFNAGHWWNYHKTIKVGCYFQEDQEVKMNMSLESAYRRSLKTLVDWIGSQVNMSKTYVLFRTHSAVHFRGGNWNSGGGCKLEPELGLLPVSSESHLKILVDVLKEHSNKSQAVKLELLDVTTLTQPRKDGHASVYYRGAEIGLASVHHQTAAIGACPASLTHGMSFFMHFSSSGNPLADESEQNLFNFLFKVGRSFPFSMNMRNHFCVVEQEKILLFHGTACRCFQTPGEIIIYTAKSWMSLVFFKVKHTNTKATTKAPTSKGGGHEKHKQDVGRFWLGAGMVCLRS